MANILIAAAILLAGLVGASPGPSHSAAHLDVRSTKQCSNSTGVLPCDALEIAGLGDRLLTPINPEYEAQVESWWAENSRLRPFCIVLPQSAEEVSTVLTALVDSNDDAGDWHIAIRSGGHSPFSNIAQGVTIDLSMLNSTTYDAATNIASLQPGARWKNAYRTLDEYGVTVTGGRDGGVGVGGFLLGGGNAFFSGRMGFGCDTIVNYEVVLADGSIINANSTHYADLWRALKGGGSNFGIVTRFDLEAIPAHKMYYDLRFLSPEYSDTVIDTVVAFTDHDETLADDALVVFYSHNATVSPDIYAATIHVNTVGRVNTSTVFKDIEKLPAMLNFTLYQTMVEAAEDSQLPGGSRTGFVTLTFLNKPELLRRCVDIHEEYVASLKQFMDPAKFTTMMFFQPIPSYQAAIGTKNGGNMLGLDDAHENMILWTIGLTIDADEEAGYARAHSEMTALKAQVKDISRAMQGDVDFVYLNYADATQDPIGSYGAENIEHMREVAERYDPDGVFQRRVPGGFKISRVE